MKHRVTKMVGGVRTRRATIATGVASMQEYDRAMSRWLRNPLCGKPNRSVEVKDGEPQPWWKSVYAKIRR